MSRQCFHCGSAVPASLNISVMVLGAAQDMCCVGCEAVADAIVKSGNEQYYKFRTDVNETPEFTLETLPAPIRDELSLYNDPSVLDDISNLIEPNQNIRNITLVIEGITCAACSWLIEKQLSKLSGVDSVSLNLSQHRLVINWRQESTPLADIIETIYSLGFKAHPYSPDAAQQNLEQEQKLASRRMVLAGLASMQAMMFAIPLYVGEWSGMLSQFEVFLRYASLVITTPVVFYSARPFFSAFIRDLKSRHLTMDVPVSIAIGGAYIASVWSVFTQGPTVYFESVCMFTFFLLLGRFLEMRARLRTGEAGNNLASLLPASAIRLSAMPVENEHIQPIENPATEEHNECVVPLKKIKVGDRIRVRPGTTIPVDGTVLKGESGVDESAFTGEFTPINKAVGSTVIGGTLNVESPLEIEVTAVGQAMQVSTVMRLLDRAQEDKPAIAAIADNVAQYFVAAVLFFSVLVFGVWYAIDPSKAFWITLSVLVVTCPCALSLATPTALTAATGGLRRKGALITRGHVLEALSISKRIVFDKTGTLTTGKLTIESCLMDSEADATFSSQKGFTQSMALELAAGLEQHSQHPIAHAFEQLTGTPYDNIKIHTGKGVEGWIGDAEFRIGTIGFATESNELTTPSPLETQTGHWIVLSKDRHPLAWLKLNDQLRADAGEAIHLLKKQGLQTELLSGDRSDQVAIVASQLSLDHATGSVSPEGKVSHLQKLPPSDTSIMVGDGINDVPVLAQAPVSIAIGGASDLAKTHADVILMSNTLKPIPEMLMHARKTNLIIKQNITWALIYNLTALPLAALGYVPPYAAAIGMSLSSLVVVGNALRLNRVQSL